MEQTRLGGCGIQPQLHNLPVTALFHYTNDIAKYRRGESGGQHKVTFHNLQARSRGREGYSYHVDWLINREIPLDDAISQ